MAVALIDIMVTRERHKVEVTSDHFWYDHAQKKMVRLSGGQLSFKYTGNKMTVTTEPLFAVKHITARNKTAIGDWVESKREELKLEILDAGVKHIAVSFPDDLRGQVENALYSERFEYEIL